MIAWKKALAASSQFGPSSTEVAKLASGAPASAFVQTGLRSGPVRGSIESLQDVRNRNIRFL